MPLPVAISARTRSFRRRHAILLAPVVVSVLTSSTTTAAQSRPVWVISGVTVGAPHAPNDEPWDSILGSIAGMATKGFRGLRNVQPDIRICMESTHVPGTCMPVCEDADWSIDSNAFVCTQATGPRGLFLEAKLHVIVQEVDPGSVRVVDDFMVDDPTKCDPCTRIRTVDGATLWIRFQFAQVDAYTGPYRAVSGTIPPPSTLPIAAPNSGGTPPPAPLPAPTRMPTAAEARQALAMLRDADSCIGADDYFPQGTVITRVQIVQMVGADQAKRLYQLAAFAIAISDPVAKQLVLNSIRSNVGDDTFYSEMQLVFLDVEQSRRLVAAFQGVAQSFVSKVADTLLGRFLPPLRSVTEIAAAVDRWIARKLLSDLLAQEAVKRMFGPGPVISAECALNELAKEGFIDAIGAR